MAESKKNSVLQLQNRDFVLLRGLFECRVMTREHVAAIYFDGKREYAKKRLQRIKADGLIGERKRQVNEQSILFLTRKAFMVLKNYGQLPDIPPLGKRSFEARANVSELTLRHELEVMDVKATFHSALAKSENLVLDTFTTWPLLHQFEKPLKNYNSGIWNKPDGFIRIHENDGVKQYAHDCFLELDRSSEVQGKLVAHASAYREYFKSGGFAVRNGGSRDDIEKFPFRVLIVLKSAARRNNTAELLAHLNPPILRQTWLTTLAEVITDPLGPIWILPGDYLNLTKGYPFYNERPNRRFEYRRQTERDIFIESKIKKKRLVENVRHSISGPKSEHVSEG